MTETTTDYLEGHAIASPRTGNIRKDWNILAVLLFVIVISGLAVAYQVFLYRDSFVQLQSEQKKREKLDDEWGRLLIEQQTFGAITQVGSNAVLRLQMYSPRNNEVVTLPDRPMASKKAVTPLSESVDSNE